MSRFSPDRVSTYYLLVAVLLGNAIIFPSVVIYFGNLPSFSNALFPALQIGIAAAAVGFILFALLLKLLPQKFHRSAALVIATLSILVWMQGNLLVWDYGPLDGSAIDWAKHNNAVWIDMAAWLAVSVLAVVLIRSGMGGVLVQFALVLFAVQLVSITASNYQKFSHLKHKGSTYSDDAFQTIANFSTSQNVLHIVIDAFQADVFEDLINAEENRQRYNTDFAGFVYYRETLGVFPRTKYSVPAFLAGEMYDNSVEHGYIESVLGGQTILSVAQGNAFNIDIVADGAYQAGHYSYLPHQNLLDLNDLPVLGARQQESGLLLDLALMRVAPGGLKKLIYNDQQWRVSNMLQGRNEHLMFEYFTNAVFMLNFVEAMAAQRAEPVYKYIHLFSTHGPKVVDPQCRYAGQVLPHHRDTYTFMAKCTLDSLAAIFNKMKQLGIYDSALILIHADHGGWVLNHRQPTGDPDMGFYVPSEKKPRLLPITIRSAASPLLAIKLPDAAGEIKTSNALASLLDIPDTVSDAMQWGTRFGHRSLLTLPENEMRKRVFRYYDREKNSELNDYTGPMAQYSILGSHYETQWQLDSILLPRKNNNSAKSSEATNSR